MKIKKNIIDTLVISLLIFSELSFYTSETLNIYISILVMSSIYVAIKLFKKRFLIKKVYNSRTLLWLTFFFLFIFIDSYIRGYGEINYLRMVSCWVMLICCWALLYGNNYSDIIKQYSLSCVITSLIGCIYIFYKDGNSLVSMKRMGDSLSGNVNSVGIALGILSFGIIYLYLTEKKKKYILVYFVNLIFMLLTGSKKVVLTIIINAIMFLKYGGNKLNRMVLAIIVGSVVIYAIFNISYLYNIIGFRIIDFLGALGINVNGANYSYSTITRENLIKVAWYLFINKPVFGHGYNSVAKYSTIGFYAHNNMLELLANYGLIGFLFFYGHHMYQANRISRSYLSKNQKLFLYSILINAIIVDIGAVTYTAAGALPYLFFIIINVSYEKANERNV